MACSAEDDFDMYLLIGHKYRLLMMTGEVLEVRITDDNGMYNSFHATALKGKKRYQFYYWDVDGAQEI